MKLLILGLILIGVLLVQIYYINKNRENFDSEVDKALVAGERKFMQGQDKYWDVRSQGIGAGLVTTKPGINDWLKFTFIAIMASLIRINYRQLTSVGMLVVRYGVRTS